MSADASRGTKGMAWDLTAAHPFKAQVVKECLVMGVTASRVLMGEPAPRMDIPTPVPVSWVTQVGESGTITIITTINYHYYYYLPLLPLPTITSHAFIYSHRP